MPFVFSVAFPGCDPDSNFVPSEHKTNEDAVAAAHNWVEDMLDDAYADGTGDDIRAWDAVLMQVDEAGPGELQIKLPNGYVLSIYEREV